MQVPVDRKTAAEALVKQTGLQADEARDLRSKKEAEQMMQQVQTEEKRADEAADDTTAKVNTNAEEQHVATRVVANSESVLAVAQRLQSAAEAALTDALGALDRAASEQKDASGQSADASQQLQHAKADASKAEQEAATSGQAWELTKQDLQQKEHALQKAKSLIEADEKDLSVEKRAIVVNNKKEQLAQESVGTTWEVEESSKTELSGEVEKMQAATLKENKQAESVAEFTITEQGDKGRAESAKVAAQRAAKAKEDAINQEKFEKEQLKSTVDSIGHYTQKIEKHEQDLTEAQARVTAQMPPQKHAVNTRDNEHSELTSLEGTTQGLQTKLAAKQQGENLLNDVLKQTTSRADTSKKVNKLRVTDATTAATAATKIEVSAKHRDEAAEVELANAPEPIGSPEEAAEAETAEEEQRLTNLKTTEEKKEDEMEEHVHHATQVHAEAEGKVKTASQQLDAATETVRLAERAVTELKERAEASSKAGTDEATRLDGKVVSAKLAVKDSEERLKKVAAELEKIKEAVSQLKILEGTITTESSHMVGEQQLEQQGRSEGLASKDVAEGKLEEAAQAAEKAKSSAEAANVHSEETSAAAAQAGIDLQIALRNLRDARAAAIDSTSQIDQSEQSQADAATKVTSTDAALKEEEKQTADANQAFTAARSDLAESEQKVVEARSAAEVAKSGIVTAKEAEQTQKENAQQKADAIPGLSQKEGEAKVAYRQLGANVKVAELRVTRFENGQDPDEDVSGVNHCVRADGTTRAIDGC